MDSRRETNDWLNAEQHARRAHHWYEIGHWHRALDELRLAIQMDPHQSEWHIGLGLTLEAMQRYDEAIEAFERALALSGERQAEDELTLLRLGSTLIRARRHERAIEVLTRVTRLNPDCCDAYGQLIMAYAGLGRHDDAELMFYHAQAIDEADPMSFDHLARSLAARGDLERAVWCWQHVRRLAPEYEGVLANLARVYRLRGQYERARQYFRRHLARNGEDSEALRDYGRLLLSLGRYREARSCFEQLLRTERDNVDAMIHLGELALVDGRADEAVNLLQGALQRDATRPGIRLGLALVANERRQRMEVRRLLIEELACDGHSGRQLLELARLLIEYDLPQRAAALLRSALGGLNDPFTDAEERVHALLYRAAALLVLERTEEGIRDCRAALALEPDNVVALQNLMLGCLQLDQLDKAAVYARKARREHPRDVQLQALAKRVRRRRLTGLVRNVLSFTSFAAGK